MKLREFNRMRDNAIEVGWEAVQTIEDGKMVVVFTKGQRTLEMKFLVEEEEKLKVMSTRFGRSDIRLNQVRNILENL